MLMLCVLSCTVLYCISNQQGVVLTGMSAFSSEDSLPLVEPPVESASAMYRAVVDKYSEFENNAEVQKDETAFYDLVRCLDAAIEHVDREGLISANELADDIATSTLQFLFLPYYYAKLCGRCPVLSRRLHYLTIANAYMHRFVERCSKLRIVSEEDVAAFVSDEAVVRPVNLYTDQLLHSAHD